MFVENKSGPVVGINNCNTSANHRICAGCEVMIWSQNVPGSLFGRDGAQDIWNYKINTKEGKNYFTYVISRQHYPRVCKRWFPTVVRIWSRDQIPAPPIVTSIQPLISLDCTSVLPFFQIFFYLNSTPAQPAIWNHGLETTVYRPFCYKFNTRRALNCFVHVVICLNLPSSALKQEHFRPTGSCKLEHSCSCSLCPELFSHLLSLEGEQNLVTQQRNNIKTIKKTTLKSHIDLQNAIKPTKQETSDE